MQSHLGFVRRYLEESGELPHRNRPHGFPVMTAQEEELTLEYIDAVRVCPDGSVSVTYRPSA